MSDYIQRWPWMLLSDEREIVDLTNTRNAYALALTKAKLDYHDQVDAAQKACFERQASEANLSRAQRELVDASWTVERPERLAALLIDYKGAELIQTQEIERREELMRIRDEAQKAFDDVCAKIAALSKRISGDRS